MTFPWYCRMSLSGVNACTTTSRSLCDYNRGIARDSKKQCQQEACQREGWASDFFMKRLDCVSSQTNQWVKGQVSTVMNVVNVVTEQNAKLNVVEIRRFISQHFPVVLHAYRSQSKSMTVLHCPCQRQRIGGGARNDRNSPLCVIPEVCEQPCSGRR